VLLAVSVGCSSTHALKPLAHGLAMVVDAHRARFGAVGPRAQEVGQLGVAMHGDEPFHVVAPRRPHGSQTYRADECILQFEDGSSVTMRLANPGTSVAVRARNSAVEYLG
jgi:hypothetical protein